MIQSSVSASFNDTLIKANIDFLKAVQQGSIRAMDAALDEGANINCRNNGGDTPLMTAALKNDAGMIMALLSRDADPCQLNQGQTALDILKQQKNPNEFAILHLSEFEEKWNKQAEEPTLKAA